MLFKDFSGSWRKFLRRDERIGPQLSLVDPLAAIGQTKEDVSVQPNAPANEFYCEVHFLPVSGPQFPVPF
jgi:hypothetical protein